MNARDAAEAFHEAYERLAPAFGYETRTDTRAFDPDSPNGRLMVAVCEEMIERIRSDSETHQAAAVKAAVKAERERCAKVARDYASKARNRGWPTAADSAAKAGDHIATAIGTLGESK